MADWVDITDTQLDPDAPLTSQLAYAGMRDNLIAVTEGAAGAPRVQAVGLQTGYLANIVVSGPSPVNVLDIGSVKRVRLNTGVAFTSTSGLSNFQVRFSADNGVNWGSYQTLFATQAIGSVATAGGVSVEIDTETGAFFAAGVYAGSGGGQTVNSTGTLTVPSNVNAISFRMSVANGWVGGILSTVEGRD